MSAVPVLSLTMMGLMTAAMMVAMMLPSIAPVLWRYHRHVRAMPSANAGGATALFAAGYASVWTIVSSGLFVISAWRSPMAMPSMGPSFAPLTVGVVLFCAGVIQCSRWKERQLVRCRECLWPGVVRGLASAWRNGCSLGIECSLSCAAPMAVLFVAGLMDARAMFAVTAAITAERIVPIRWGAARLTGALALVGGTAICLHAFATTFRLV